MVQVKRGNVINNKERVKEKVVLEKDISGVGLASNVRELIERALREEGLSPGVTFVYKYYGIKLSIERE